MIKFIDALDELNALLKTKGSSGIAYSYPPNSQRWYLNQYRTFVTYAHGAKGSEALAVLNMLDYLKDNPYISLEDFQEWVKRQNYG